MNRSICSLLLVSVLSTASLSAIAGEAAAAPSAKEDLAFARSLSRAFRSVAAKVEPSVVHITQLAKVQQVQRDFFGFPVAVGPERLQATGLGSGFLISSDGFIVTNNHVVERAQEFRVKFADGHEQEARLIGRDAATDLAVLKVEGSNFTPIEFGNSDELEQGDWVVAVGSPLGLSNSVTAGIVSAKGRSGIGGLQSYQDFIQTDAAINPGNSGGPLVNLEGKLVGVNSAIASKSGGYEGIGFAIPTKVAQSVTTSLMKTGRVQRGWLGIDFERMQPDPTKRAVQGVKVSQIMEASPAEQAGLKPGDVITEFDGKAIDSDERLVSLIALSAPKTEVSLGVLRGGKKETIKAVVGDQGQAAQSMGAVYIGDLGLTVRDLTADEIKSVNRRFRRAGQGIQSGVVVTQVESGSRAETAEFTQGDVIFSVGDRALRDAKSFDALAPRFDFKGGVNFGVIRGTQKGTITVQD